MSPLRFFVPTHLRVPELRHISLLYPFWGQVRRKNEPFVSTAESEHGFDSTYYSLVDTAAEADYYLIPYDYWQLKKTHPRVLEAMVNEAVEAHLPLLIDASGDVWGTVSVDHPKKVPPYVVLRINQYRFLLPSYEITVPVQCQDLLEVHQGGIFTPRVKSSVPSIGFVGWGALSLKQRMRALVKEIPVRVRSLFNARYKTMRKGVFWREKSVRVFRDSSRVQSNFIIRSGYGGNVTSITGDAEKSRSEFVRNILDTDYTLITRGDANIATRFYETLSLGRIPVLIDTECMLPLEHLINYKEFCVVIDWRDLKRAPDILADFHHALSPEAFLAMQQKARYSFETYLRFDAFTKYLVEMLRERLKQTTL